MKNLESIIIEVPLSEEEIAEFARLESEKYDRDYAAVQELRRLAYQRDADPLYFGFQRGDNTEQAWLDAVQAVKDANPYPETPAA